MASNKYPHYVCPERFEIHDGFGVGDCGCEDGNGRSTDRYRMDDRNDVCKEMGIPWIYTVEPFFRHMDEDFGADGEGMHIGGGWG